MKFTADITTKTWSFDEEELANSYIDIKFAFRENGNLPVVFDQMAFGYSLVLNSENISEESRPFSGMSYVSTDQDYIESFMVTGLIAGKEYTVNVWAENAGDIWQDSVNFILPFPPQPYASWILDEETGIWASPIPYPDDNELYQWDEEAQSWVPIELS